MKSIKAPEKRWGIVVGVDKYVNANKHLCNLQGCVADANNMFEAMTAENGFGFLKEHVVKLENATRNEIEGAFKKIGSKMKQGDEIWFYYAGHGYSEKLLTGNTFGYLLPSDVKIDSNGELLSTQECIAHSTLWEQFIGRNITCGNVTVVLFLDCCCAASIGQQGIRSGSMNQEVVTNFESSFRDLKSRCAGDDEKWDFHYISFMATDKTGKAKEDATGGVFTKSLILGLKGGEPDYCTVGPDPDDIHIRAGVLGSYLAWRTPNCQNPCQDVRDASFPLSVSQDRKSLLEENRERDQRVVAWLLAMQDQNLLGRKARQFAEDMMDSTAGTDFKYAGLLRKLLRRLGSRKDECSCQLLEEGAGLIQAFFEFKNLPEEREPQKVAPAEERPIPVSGGVLSWADLSPTDKKLLEDVLKRFSNEDKISQSKFRADVITGLHNMARKRMRRMCKTMRFDLLFDAAFHNEWHMKARKGFDSRIEGALYELVKDDEALL